MKFLLYEGRHGERLLTPHNQTAWDYLITELENDDRQSIEDSRADGFCVDGGTFEEGFVSVDDGGRICTLELTTDPNDPKHF